MYQHDMNYLMIRDFFKSYLRIIVQIYIAVIVLNIFTNFL